MATFTQQQAEAHQARVAAGKRKASPEGAEGYSQRPDSGVEVKLPKVKLRSRKGYDVKVVLAYFESQGVPKPEVEYRFHPDRKWRFDFGWRFLDTGGHPLALEVDGGIWIQGGHNRGAQMLATWEKENEACCMGWRILRCQPKDLLTLDTTSLIKRALGIA